MQRSSGVRGTIEILSSGVAEIDGCGIDRCAIAALRTIVNNSSTMAMCQLNANRAFRSTNMFAIGFVNLLWTSRRNGGK